MPSAFLEEETLRLTGVEYKSLGTGFHMLDPTIDYVRLSWA
jgi:hypothetical protein